MCGRGDGEAMRLVVLHATNDVCVFLGLKPFSASDPTHTHMVAAETAAMLNYSNYVQHDKSSNHFSYNHIDSIGSDELGRQVNSSTAASCRTMAG